MNNTQNPRPSRTPSGSRPRPELRKGGKPAVQTAQGPQTEHRSHLMDYLTVPRIAVCLVVFVALIGGAFYFNNDSRNQRLGVRARAEMKKERWDRSIAAWKPLYDQFPESPLINMGMGRCYLETKKPDLALKHLEEAEANSDKLGDYSSQLDELRAMKGWALLDLGRTQEGVDVLQKELAADPDNPMANFVLGSFLAKNNEPVRAGMHFQRIANRPEYAADIAKFRKNISDVFLRVPDSELMDVPEKVSPKQVSSLLALPPEQKPPAK